MGSVTYKLLLPKYICVFRIFLLKPLLTSEQGPILEAKSILQSCILLQQGQPVPQVLVHCEGVSSDDATLEDWLQLSKTYPSLNLEDKVVFHGDGIFFLSIRIKLSTPRFTTHTTDQPFALDPNVNLLNADQPRCQ